MRAEVKPRSVVREKYALVIVAPVKSAEVSAASPK